MTAPLAIATLIVVMGAISALSVIHKWLRTPNAKDWVSARLYEEVCALLKSAREENKSLARDFKWERNARIAEAIQHRHKIDQLRGEFPKAVPRVIAKGEVVSMFHRQQGE